MKTFFSLFIFSFLFAISIATPFSSVAQRRLNTSNGGNALLVNMHYGIDVPAATLRERFGQSNQTGGGLEIITDKHNLLVGCNINYHFGAVVKEDVLSNIRTIEGNIIGKDRIPAQIFLRERGLFLGGYVGKLFTTSFKNPRSGIRTTLGGGLLQHRIRLQDDSRTVAQVTGEYLKGYDRLTNGLALQEFIGYQHLSLNRQANFYIGLEMTQGFTKSRRDWDWNTQQKDTRNRLDLLFSLKLNWTLPFYFGENAEQIYY